MSTSSPATTPSSSSSSSNNSLTLPTTTTKTASSKGLTVSHSCNEYHNQLSATGSASSPYCFNNRVHSGSLSVNANPEESRNLIVTGDRLGRTTTVLSMDSGASARSSSISSAASVGYNVGGRGSTAGVCLLPVDDDDDNVNVAFTEAELAAQLRLQDLLRKASEEDLSSIETSNCIYHAGFDKQGRAVIVFIGKWFKHSELELDKALLYLLKTLDPVVDQDYVVVYFHTRTSRDNIPSYGWIREVYGTLTRKYKKNLKAFYVVHPTLWTKMTCWWFSTFMAPAIKNKIHNVHALKELAPVMEERDLGIPMFITEQDMVFNGLRYYEP